MKKIYNKFYDYLETESVLSTGIKKKVLKRLYFSLRPLSTQPKKR